VINDFFSPGFKGALFRTATEQKEQTRYFSKSVLFMIPFPVVVCSMSYQIFTAILFVHKQLQEEHGQQVVM
jgi:DNA excision repair protein ERCC-6-like